MYYKLDKKFAFRGWKGLPFAIRRMDPEGYLERPLFLDKETFLAALRCNGVEHVDEDSLSERDRGVLEEMVAHGVAAKSDEPMGPLESYQRHHVYDGLYLEAVHWSITGKCNYRCRHCLVSAPTACHPEPSFEQIVNIADQIKRCGVRKVDITGGEPLVRRDFIDVVRALMERGIHIDTMFTNTALLTGELLDQMEALGQHPSFQISYDGYGHHDWLRGIPGAEEEAKAACELLHERGYNYAVAACIHKGNKDSLPDLWRYLAPRGCQALRVNAPQVLGEWTHNFDGYGLSHEQTWETYAKVITTWYADGMPIDLNLDGFFAGSSGRIDYQVPYVKYTGENADLSKVRYCGAMRHMAYISPEGQLVPCMGFSGTALSKDFPSILGENSIGDVTGSADNLYSKVTRTSVADMVGCAEENPECAECEHLGECRGGCMVQDVTDDGNHLHHDETCCWFFKSLGKKAVDEVALAAIEKYVPGGLNALEKEREERKKRPGGPGRLPGEDPSDSSGTDLC